MRGHGAGAGVGEQVDQDVVGGEQEEIVVGGLEEVVRVAARVVQRMGSTLLMRKGSMMVLTGMGLGSNIKIEARNAPSYLAD